MRRGTGEEVEGITGNSNKRRKRKKGINRLAGAGRGALGGGGKERRAR